jgi:hypothetical protein
VTYLQELHSLGLANSDHTTLLLNTYTKLGDMPRLDAFIKSSSTSLKSQAQAQGNAAGNLNLNEKAPYADEKSGEGQDSLPFDLDTAIRVCRQAGYFEHAAYLAKKYQRHEDFLRIMVEDVGDGMSRGKEMMGHFIPPGGPVPPTPAPGGVNGVNGINGNEMNGVGPGLGTVPKTPRPKIDGYREALEYLRGLGSEAVSALSFSLAVMC